MAFSADAEDKALEMAEKHRARFPVGFGANPVTISAETGCFYEGQKRFLHATGYILDPEGRIVLGVYSTGPLGRLEAETSLSAVEYHRQG